jgi:hypothetical protein
VAQELIFDYDMGPDLPDMNLGGMIGTDLGDMDDMPDMSLGGRSSATFNNFGGFF